MPIVVKNFFYSKILSNIEFRKFNWRQFKVLGIVIVWVRWIVTSFSFSKSKYVLPQYWYCCTLFKGFTVIGDVLESHAFKKYCLYLTYLYICIHAFACSKSLKTYSFIKYIFVCNYAYYKVIKLPYITGKIIDGFKLWNQFFSG